MNKTEYRFDQIDHDEILRQAHAMRAEAIAEFGRSIAAYFRRNKLAAKPQAV